MAIAALIVAVRTTGAAQLTRLGTSFRRLASNIRVAYARFAIAGGLAGAMSRSFNRLARNVDQAARAMLRFAAASAIAGLTRLLDGVGNGIVRVAAGMAQFAAIAAVAATVIVPLIGAIGNLVPLLLLVAPAAFVAVPALGALVLAFKGVGAALQASGDPKKFAEALKQLTPAARSAVRTLVDLGREWKRTQKLVQESFFTGFRQDAIGVSRALQPLADKWLPRIAGSFRDLRTYLANGLSKAAKDGRLEGVMRNLSLALDDITRAAGSFAKAFGAALVGASPLFERMTSAIATGAEKFAVWLDEAQKSGKLAEWLDKAVKTFGQLKELAGNIGGIIAGIFNAGDGGQGFLETMISLTGRMKDFINSADGQAMVRFFNTIIAAIASTEPVWAILFGQINNTKAAFGFLADAAVAGWNYIKTATLLAVLAIVGQMALIITAAAKAFGWIPGIGPKLQDAARAVNNFVTGVNNALQGIKDKQINVTVNFRTVGDARAAGAAGALAPRPGGKGLVGYASGTMSAPRGYAIVGERGPELVYFNGGEQVKTASATRAALSSGIGVGAPPIRIVVAPGPGAAGNPWVEGYLQALRNGLIRMTVDRSGRVVPA